MNKTKTGFILLSLCFLFSGVSLFSQKVPEQMVRAFANGNVDILSEYFNERLQINLPEQEFLCSKAQAKEIMRDFFSKNKPSSFKIIFEGGKSDSNFSIGTLTSSTGKYRVNIFSKKFDGKNLVHLLRIEKDDNRTF